MFNSPRYRFLTSKFNFDDYSSKGSVVHPVKKHHRVLAAGSPYAIEGPEGESDENKQLAISKTFIVFACVSDLPHIFLCSLSEPTTVHPG